MTMIRSRSDRVAMTASRFASALALVAALCLPACASRERSSAARSVAGGATSGAACATGSPALRELRLAPGDAAGARDSLRLLAPGQLKLGDVSRLDGTCAGRLQAFRMADLYLSETLALRLGEDGQPHPSSDDATGYRALFAIGAGQPHPTAPRGDFVMATSVQAGATGDGAGEFVGLWRQGAVSTLYAFSRDAGGRFGAARPLLDSRLPLRSVSYFPGPDSPSGRLGLVQEAAGEIRLISIDWFHPQPAPR